MNTKKQNERDNSLRVLGPNGYLLRDEILDILLCDMTIYELLCGNNNKNNEHLYWDDSDLVSTHYDNQAIASIGFSYIKNKSDQKQTIGDMKKDIIEFCAKQKRQVEKHNNDINKTINDLEDIYENILSDVFYDMRWEDEEDDNKQNNMLVGLDHAIRILKKKRK
jgi:hypothetical protein